jgi:hypothetical protein
MIITVQDFTGVYAEQPFMQELREKSAKSADIHWLDCTKIVGTDCYCDDDAVKAINEMIDKAESRSNTECNGIIENRDSSKCSNTSANDIAEQPAIHFFDNGNYHYMSKLWTDRVQEPFSLIVFDHHPDMQPPRFGGILSCGGWVLEVLENNKFIQNVVIIGVADHLADEIREELTQTGNPQILNKVTFIKESELSSIGLDSSPKSLTLLKQQVAKYRISATPQNDDGNRIHLTSHTTHSTPIYLSIDKDALAPAFAATNWDQGSLTLDALKKFITEIAANHKILGIDICGERAHDFEGDAFHTVQNADSINNALNCELLIFLQKL